jgi:uncharacterized protein YjbI with pentapeptide repeats
MKYENGEYVIYHRVTGKELWRGKDLKNLTGADLTRANLTRANLAGANLTRANLAGADLSEADLAGADLSWADLAGADLSEADLFGANLTEADLTEANLSEADLSWADLAGAKYLCPPMVLLASWGTVSDELCLDLMRYDAANHPNPEKFIEWAKGGSCPYSGDALVRSANFMEKRELIDEGFLDFPVKSAYELMVRLIDEKCKKEE